MGFEDEGHSKAYSLKSFRVSWGAGEGSGMPEEWTGGPGEGFGGHGSIWGLGPGRSLKESNGPGDGTGGTGKVY